MRRAACLILTILVLALPQIAQAQRGEKWVASWVASAQGPYPVGNPSAQPDQKFAFPSAPAGANDQTFRMIVRMVFVFVSELEVDKPAHDRVEALKTFSKCDLARVIARVALENQ